MPLEKSIALSSTSLYYYYFLYIHTQQQQSCVGFERSCCCNHRYLYCLHSDGNIGRTFWESFFSFFRQIKLIGRSTIICLQPPEKYLTEKTIVTNWNVNILPRLALLFGSCDFFFLVFVLFCFGSFIIRLFPSNYYLFVCDMNVVLLLLLI
jgi:hypothetical protein